MDLLTKINTAQRNANEAVVVANLESIELKKLQVLRISNLPDPIPAPSHAEGEAACILLNSAWKRIQEPLSTKVIEWPHGTHRHASGLFQFRQLLANEL